MFSATRTSKHLSAETILKTDTPRTRELKTLRAKRLAYFVGPNRNCTNIPIADSSSEANDKQSFVHNVSYPPRENLLNAEHKGKALDCNDSVQYTRIQDIEKGCHSDLEPSSLALSRNDKAIICLPKPDYNMLHNPTISEIQKLRHILSWAQKILKNSEKAMTVPVSQNICAVNEKDIVSHMDSDTKQSSTFHYSQDTDQSIHTTSSTERLCGSHYSADASRSSDSCSSLELLRPSRTLIQNSSLATSLVEEQCNSTNSDYSSKQHIFPDNIWKGTFSEEETACGDNVSNNNWKNSGVEEGKVHEAQLESLANKSHHFVISDMSAVNRDKYFWSPLEGSSDEENGRGNGERMEPTKSTGTVTLRKSSAICCYTSNQLTSPINLRNTTERSASSLYDSEKCNYTWEFLEAEEYLSAGNHKMSKEYSAAAGLPDSLLNLENARFEFKSQMNSSAIPKLDLSTTCKGTTVTSYEAMSANDINEGTKLVTTFQEGPQVEQFPKRPRNLNLTNGNKTLLSDSSMSPKCCSGKISDKMVAKKHLALRSDPLKKETNDNHDENEARQKIIDYQSPSNLTSASSSLLLSSDSSYSKESNSQFVKEQSNGGETDQIMGDNIDSFLSISNLVKFCPTCASGNSSTDNWCMECGCVLIGITPQFDAVTSNVNEISSLNHRDSPMQKKSDMLLTKATAASNEHSDIVDSDEINSLKYSTFNTCISSETSDPELNTYDKYLLYMEHLQKIRGQHQAKEQQPTDMLLLKENGNQKEVVNKSNSYSLKQEMAKYNTATFKASACFSGYTDKFQLGYGQDSEGISMIKPDLGAICLEEKAEEICIIPETSVQHCIPDRKGVQQINYVETARNIGQRVFLKHSIGTQQNQISTFENKKITFKDVKPRKRTSIQSRLNQYKRCWEKSSTAWSSYAYGAVKPRSTNMNQPRSADDCQKFRKETPLHSGSSAVSLRQLIKRPVSAKVPNSKRAPQETSRSKTPLHTTAVTSLKTIKTCEVGESLNNAFQPCDKLAGKGADDHLLWLYLPDEIWIQVFTLLSHQDLCQVAQVCHCFYRLANDETLWKIIQIENCNCLNDDRLASIGQHHPQSLRLYRCNDRRKCITTSGIKKLFNHCKDSLKELNVTSCSGPMLTGDTILLCASAVCLKLTSVDVSWTAATSRGIIALAQASSCLHRLFVNGCQLTDESIEVLTEKHKTSLEELEVFGCHELSAPCLSYMARKCSNLQNLNIGRIPNITTSCLIQMVTSLQHLTVLNLSGLNAVHDRVVHHIVRQCPKMDRLTLSFCPQLTDVSLFEIGTYLPTIRHLDVSGCKKITDTGVQALAMSCHKLQYLDLSSTTTTKTGLKLLHLYGCHSIHDLKAIQDVNKQVKLHHDLPLSIVTN
ncbi:uncharacterized protein LOC109936683 isoform X2 [Rhincodon typus]|uniref:uncharacterized protein LOC109936683 isoform X2 n=1 Tax=Rhincodon typus TaxID=259920 RepID=UPI0020302818|nr:uncharacterized protein LOC109936683 isoform X2 [Rhincodon typus]